uniref:Peroxidase 17 n=1 Tax=Aegilops tauschii TaxID=37682 RepID=M8CZP4_AEGTA
MAPPRVGLLLALALCLAFARADAAVRDLKVGYYAQTCPRAEEIVRRVMARALAREARSVASVMRLQFHDCFVNGCDGSVLMDATPTMAGEKEALSNINSLRSFEVVDEVKSALEEQCPGIVSCADIIIMAARDAVVLFSQNQDAFFRAFIEGMVKLGELQNPRKGEIRRNCRVGAPAAGEAGRAVPGGGLLNLVLR